MSSCRGYLISQHCVHHRVLCITTQTVVVPSRVQKAYVTVFIPAYWGKHSTPPKQLRYVAQKLSLQFSTRCLYWNLWITPFSWLDGFDGPYLGRHLHGQVRHSSTVKYSTVMSTNASLPRFVSTWTWVQDIDTWEEAARYFCLCDDIVLFDIWKILPHICVRDRTGSCAFGGLLVSLFCVAFNDIIGICALSVSNPNSFSLLRAPSMEYTERSHFQHWVMKRTLWDTL